MTAPVNVGDVLAGKYRVERVLGEGGMGVVVAARHLQLDERVAIKFLLPEAIHDRDLTTRFLREGRAAAKIRSEHIARVYDVGTLETGAPYLVMEFLDGSDLNALVTHRGPLPIDVAVEYALQACEALAEAHAHGIIHRDIKPANLFVTTRSDGSPQIKVIDFGISKLGPSAGEGLDLTKTVETRGSPLYMSPEQMTSTRSVDARSDIWSLGITLHYLLTRTYPFHGVTLPQLCGLILTGEPTPLRAARPSAPVELERIILRCLRKDPAARYANVAEVAAALAELAPPHGRTSAARISRVLRVEVAPYGRATMPSGPPSSSSLGSSSPGMLAQPGAVTPMHGASTWGSPGHPQARSPLGIAVAGVAAGLSVALVAGLVIFLRRDGGSTSPASQGTEMAPTVSVASAAPPVSTPAAVVVAPAAPAEAAVEVVLDEDPPAAPSASSRASAAATASASAKTLAGAAKAGAGGSKTPKPVASAAPSKPASKSVFGGKLFETTK